MSLRKMPSKGIIGPSSLFLVISLLEVDELGPPHAPTTKSCHPANSKAVRPDEHSLNH